MSYLTESLKIEILMMIAYGDRARTQCEVVRLFRETHPDLPPLNQGTISKIEAQYREMGHVKKVPSKRQAVVDDDTKLNLLLALEENPITPACQLARDSNLNHKTVLKILKYEKNRPYKMQAVQELLEDDPDRRYLNRTIPQLLVRSPFVSPYLGNIVVNQHVLGQIPLQFRPIRTKLALVTRLLVNGHVFGQVLLQRRLVRTHLALVSLGSVLVDQKVRGQIPLLLGLVGAQLALVSRHLRAVLMSQHVPGQVAFQFRLVGAEGALVDRVLVDLDVLSQVLLQFRLERADFASKISSSRRLKVYYMHLESLIDRFILPLHMSDVVIKQERRSMYAKYSILSILTAAFPSLRE
ncbi:hypothetical protein NQ318_012054 [Aromia moschata]|uniref:DUF4817 domain-containing protein n=1 Tax=Aromia moschata TaxID=1265417 RepID=A0AAV8XLR1_9CUCU|nr:hypothetical protein NQ318_012054 [Aromia moschata]